MEVHVFRRVSTDEQVESGAGLGSQLVACREWAARKGLTIAGEYTEDEAISGAAPLDRCPVLMSAVANMKKGDVLLVAKRDRIARSQSKVWMLESLLKRKQCSLVSAAGEGTDHEDPNDPGAFLFRSMIDMFAEYELMVTRSRTRGALANKKKRNERTGRVPYGMDLVDDGKRSKPRKDRHGNAKGNLPIGLVRNEREQAVLADMRRWKREGWTHDRICWALNNQGVTTKAGKPWQVSSVAYVLKHSKGTDGQADPTPGPQAPA